MGNDDTESEAPRRSPAIRTARRVYDLEQELASHRKVLTEMHVWELGKPQKDALPEVLQAHVFNEQITSAARRRLTLIVGASSTIAAAIFFVADMLTRYVWPPHP